MRVSRKTEFAPAQTSRHQQERRGGNNPERNQLLPIHSSNITLITGSATNDFYYICGGT